jgi:hypothetical protein
MLFDCCAQLILEFKDAKPPAPPPFNVLWNLCYDVPLGLRRRLRPPPEELPPTGGFKRIPDVKTLRLYQQREQDALKHCLKARQKRQAATTEARAEAHDRAIAKLEEQNRARFETLNGVIEEQNSRLMQLMSASGAGGGGGGSAAKQPAGRRGSFMPRRNRNLPTPADSVSEM